jgi:uncharacterized protein YhaN
MRFRRLSLDAFGPFTGLSLDLSRASGNGLHLIYGPNEAGKSSALRAISDLLFGIPEKTPDAHLHPGPALRLSASIERAGEELVFARRKKRKDSLVGPDDKPLEAARLARFMNGLDTESFERLFALDYERLKEGGEQTLNGEGDVGEALFDAGASGRSVHRVKLALVKEAEELFKDRGQNPKLNRLLSEYTEHKRRAKDSIHSPEKYAEQQQRVREKAREAEARRAELARLRAEKDHALRLKNVLSSVLERDRKAAERATLGELPSLRRGTGEERERLLAALLELERDVRRLTHKRGEEQARLAALPEPGPLVGMSVEAAGALRTGIGAAKSSIGDLPKRQSEARTVRDAIVSKLPRLGLGDNLDEVLARSLPLAQRERLSRLANDMRALTVKVEASERELPEARARVQALTAILKQARAARRLERDTLPPREMIERFDGELSQAEESVATLDERLRESERERAGLLEQLALLRGKDGVPTAAAVAQARVERDARLREAQELAADPKRKALELCLPLAALAQASGYADSLSDRLRTEAKRVADVEALEHQLASHDHKRLSLVEARERAAESLTRVEARWQELAKLLGFGEILPLEAARLVQDEQLLQRELQRHEQDLAHAQAALSAAEVRAEEAQRAVVGWRVEWKAVVAPLGLDEHARPEEAAVLLNGLSDLSAQRETLDDREKRVVKIQRDIDAFDAKVRQQTERLAPELSPRAPEEAPEAARQLLERYDRESELAKQRAGIEAELSRMARELAELEARRTEHAVALGELCRAAGVADADALLALEQRVARGGALTSEIAALDARLAEVSEGEDIGALVEEARRSDRGVVAARLGELDEAIALADEESRGLERDVRELELGLRAYAGRDGADASQELSACVSQLAELSAVWTRRRLAAAVLERVVEQYRERHQGPVLTRASELFSRLTLGEYSRLQTGLEETRLECVRRADGKSLELEHLSRGTRFQLFLALKLASLEEYLKTAPPLPLLLDDVLVEWDDERSRVALEVLAEFSERLQILLFTHHGRDVAAAEALADGRIFTHHLVPRYRPEVVDLGDSSSRNFRDG